MRVKLILHKLVIINSENSPIIAYSMKIHSFIWQKSSRNMFLEVGEDRIILKTRPNLFFLDIDLPFLVDNEGTGAQYDTRTNMLTITLSVTAKAPF